FKVIARKVGDRQFVHTHLQLGDLGGDFRLETKAVGFKLHILNDLRPEELITGLHIGEIEAGEKITEHREESVHHIMESPVYLRIRLLKPRSINHIGPLIEQGLQELGYVMNVVFKVSILDSNNLTSRCFDSTAQRRALALIYVL